MHYRFSDAPQTLCGEWFGRDAEVSYPLTPREARAWAKMLDNLVARGEFPRANGTIALVPPPGLQPKVTCSTCLVYMDRWLEAVGSDKRAITRWQWTRRGLGLQATGPACPVSDTWTSRDGRRVKLIEMEESHLYNAMRWLWRNGDMRVDNNAAWFAALRAEARRRGLKLPATWRGGEDG